MLTPLAVLAGKAFRFALRIRGGGSAFPGGVALAIQPKFLAKTLGRMEKGIFFVSGSNGKSTTTSMLVRVLREHGLTVLTNPAGGNLPQGLASALLAKVNWIGRLNHDVAILEVDEGYGKLIAAKVAPNGLLLTNIQLDQLNRFHSPEEVYGHLLDLAEMTKDFMVVNGSDSNTERLALSQSSRLDVAGVYVGKEAMNSSVHGILSAPNFEADLQNLPVVSELVQAKSRTAVITVGLSDCSVSLPAPGLHYAVDAALAIGMAKRIIGPSFTAPLAAKAISESPAVYGRGEVIEYQNQRIQIIMMKNLPSLQANLDALEASPKCVWISVDEGTPDPSWIYDIDLSNISHVNVISGTKTFQWATRLAYGKISYDALIEDSSDALEYFLALPDVEKTAIVNYEQMMWLRKKLGLLNLEGENV